MSEFDKLIAQWRKPLEARLGTAETDELEDHLRTVTDSLASTGLSESERLAVAIHRMGKSDNLATEFEKNSSARIWRERIAWMLIGFLPLHWLDDLTRSIGAIFASASLLHGNSSAVSLLPTLAAQIAFVGAILGVCWLAGRGIQSERWKLNSWLPATFGRRALLMGIAGAGLYLLQNSFGPLVYHPIVASLHDHHPEDYIHRLQTYMIHSQVSRQWLQLVFSAIFGVVFAWLISSRRSESETVKS